MKKFAFKIILISIPFILIILIYIVTDPFKILYHYKSYYESGRKGYALSLNYDFVSTETFLNNYKSLHYDSYIFGSSRSTRYRIEEWKKYVNTKDCFHFFGWDESLYGVGLKIKFLAEKGQHIKNALVIIDSTLLSKLSNGSYVQRKHPAISGENWLSFHMHFLKMYFTLNFLKEYLYYLYTHHPYEKGLTNFTYEYKLYDNITNEFTTPLDIEIFLEKKRDSIYKAQKHLFYPRDKKERYYSPVILQGQIEILEKINKAFIDNNTNYEIIVSPMYDQKKLHPNDITILYKIFGRAHIHDFSGINNYTNSIYNFSDPQHYNPIVATKILKEVYQVNRSK